MKKKIIAIFLILCLCTAIVGCGGKEVEEKETKATKATTATTETTEKETKATTQVATEKKEEADQTKKEEEKSESMTEGLNLVKGITFERPATLRIVSEMIASGMTTTMTTYYDGDKSKTEVDVPGMPKSILIHNPSKEIMYQYVYGESTGMKITDAKQESAQELGMMMDTSLLTALVEGASEDITARIDYLEVQGKSEEVIYIEAMEKDEELGEMLVKMWYSQKYATPLKYEVYTGDTLMMELMVKKISDNISFNADTFMPPLDVQFQEISMEALMNMW